MQRQTKSEEAILSEHGGVVGGGRNLVVGGAVSNGAAEPAALGGRPRARRPDSAFSGALRRPPRLHTPPSSQTRRPGLHI